MKHYDNCGGDSCPFYEVTLSITPSRVHSRLLSTGIIKPHARMALPRAPCSRAI
jgi:hypothetical protein